VVLAITSDAAEAIRQIIAEAGYDETAGLRVGLNRINDEKVSLQLLAAQAPAKGDHVVDYEGVKLFIEPQAYTTLDDRILDARVSDTGAMRFSMNRQEGVQDSDMWARGSNYVKAAAVDPIQRGKNMRAKLQERQQRMGIDSARALIKWFEGPGGDYSDPILTERMDMVTSLWSTSKNRGRNFTKSTRPDSSFF
jgi:Fe-S cluster assembly iron-binding protein IscA